MKASSSERILQRRALRAAELRPIQIWVPDTRQVRFAEECRRQSRSLRNDPHEQKMGEWLEAVADMDGWK